MHRFMTGWRAVAVAAVPSLSLAWPALLGDTAGERAKAVCEEAEQRIANGQYSMAIPICRAALVVDPSCAIAYVRLGEAYGSSDRPIEALEAYDHAILCTRDQTDAAHIVSVEQELARSAVESLSERLALPPFAERAPAMLASRGRCRLALDDRAGADADAEEAIGRDPRSPYGPLLKALIALDAADWAAAEKPLARTAELGAPDAELLETLRTIRADHERADWALCRSALTSIRAYQRAPSNDERQRMIEDWAAFIGAAKARAAAGDQPARTDLEYADSLRAEAASAFERRDYPTAISRCEVALVFQPHSHPLAQLFARSLHEAGNDERAVRALGFVLLGEVDAESTRLRNDYAQAALRRICKTSGGSEERSLPAQPASPEDEIRLRDLDAELLEYRIEDYIDEALRCSREAVRLVPGSPVPYESMMETLDSASRYEEELQACDEWRLRLEANGLDATPAEDKLADLIWTHGSLLEGADARVRERPTDVDHWYEYGLGQLQRIDLTTAAATAEIMIALRPGDSRGYSLRAEILERNGAGTAQVLAECQHALTLDGRDARAAEVARRVHLKLGDNEWVLNDLTRAIDLAPKDEVLRRLLTDRADLYLSLAQYDKAIDDYTRSIAVNRFFASHATRGRREAWLRVGDYESVLEDTEIILRDYPEDRLTLRERLRALQMKGDEAGAAALAAQLAQPAIAAIAPPPEPPEQDVYASAVAADKRGELDAASQGYDKVLELDPGHAGALLRRAVLYLSAGETLKASRDVTYDHEAYLDALRLLDRVQQTGYTATDAEIQAYENAVKDVENLFSPGTRTKNEAACEVAGALIRQSKAEAAVSVLTEYLGEFPDDVHMLEMRGRIILAKLDDPAAPQMAALDLARCIDLRPDEPSYRELMAKILGASGDVEGALRQYGRAIELAPEKELSYREERAWLLMSSGDLDRTSQELDRLTQIAPDRAWWCRRLVASSLRASGDMNRLARAIELAPAYEPWYRESIAGHLEDSGDIEGALSEYGRAIELAPAETDFLVARASLLSRTGSARGDAAMIDQALSDCVRACELAPLEPAYRIQAYIHEARGEFDEALRCADEIERVAPWSSIPDLPRSYAARAREKQQLETEHAEYARREAERLATEKRIQAEKEAAARQAEQSRPFLERLREAFEQIDPGSGGSAGVVQSDWRPNVLQQKLDAESAFNAHCHDLERRFGSGAADTERSIWRP